MMRTEDDLRAAFRAIAQQSPEADHVLRALYDRPRGAARPLHLWPRLLRQRRLRRHQRR